MEATPARIALLRDLVNANGIQLGSDNSSVQELNDWFRTSVDADPNHPGRLLPEWYSVVSDVSLFLGESMIERCPGLHWQFFVGGKTDISYQRPVIMGFRRVPNRKYNVDMGLRVANYAHQIVASRGSVAHYGRRNVRGVEIDVDAVARGMRDRPVEPDAFRRWLEQAEGQC